MPSLSQLRTLAGRDAFVTNPVEAIKKALQNDGSPVGTNCVMCGARDPVVYECYALCESTHAKNQSVDQSTDILRLLRLTFLFVFSKALFIASWWTRVFDFREQKDEIEIRGHDVEVEFPLPVCDSCSNSAGAVTRAKVAKQLMARVPMYKALLDQYPDVKLEVSCKQV